MQIRHNHAKRVFEAFGDNDVRMGEIAYSPHDGALAATHTFTEDEFRGRGVAGQLLDALVEYAVANNLKIIPVCSYVKAAFAKDPGKYQSVMC